MAEVLIDSELLSCPICADVFVDACDTSCGHTFCEYCLNMCLESKPERCPVCSKNPSPVHPAFTIRSMCNAIAPITKLDDEMTVESEKELGNACYYKNKFAQAISHYNNAINKCTNTSDPKNSYLYNNRSQCFIHLHQYRRALDDCEEALRVNQNNVKGLMRKGLCLRQLGQFEASRAAYQKASELDTNKEWAQQIADGLNALPIFKTTTTNNTQPPPPQHQPPPPQQQQHRPPQQQQQQQRPQSQQIPQQPPIYYQYAPQQYPQQINGYPQFNQNHARYSTNYPGQYRPQQPPYPPQQQQQQQQQQQYNYNTFSGTGYRPTNQPPVFNQPPPPQPPQPPQQPQQPPQPQAPPTTTTTTSNANNSTSSTNPTTTSNTSSSNGRRSRSNSGINESNSSSSSSTSTSSENNKKNCKQQ
ncbi:RING zinc finger-containing protein [Tieghemostelium lacteum]|uniref:RING zinc finger-containing protein n=1 Tax=Tieghemostelium lacteum TaxID=361077 RepID=A0A151ZJL2_TIELA|nr:RING zinc finger-containing protein [Tieghemostelium lacteum]|eukprot:KYQ94188.1 RING zinc finger-containing protein [Tieghemostelium lacteum]